MSITPTYKTQPRQTLYDQDGLLVQVQHIFDGEHWLPFMHASIDAWGPSKYRQFSKVWQNIKQELAMVHPCVFVAIRDDDPLLYKFETKAGFKEVDRNNNIILMMQELE